MASKEMKQLREKLTKQAIDDHQIAKTGGTPTELFRCGKCRQNKCTYTQVCWEDHIFVFWYQFASAIDTWFQLTL